MTPWTQRKDGILCEDVNSGRMMTGNVTRNGRATYRLPNRFLPRHTPNISPRRDCRVEYLERSECIYIYCRTQRFESQKGKQRMDRRRIIAAIIMG